MKRLWAGMLMALFFLFSCALPVWADTTVAPPSTTRPPTTSASPVDGTTLPPWQTDPITGSEGSNPLTEPTEPPPETDEFGNTIPPPPSIITEPPTTKASTTGSTATNTSTGTQTSSTRTGPTYRRPYFTGEQAPLRSIPDFYEWVTTPDGQTYPAPPEASEDYRADDEGNRSRTILTIAAVAGILLMLVAIIFLARRRSPEEEEEEEEEDVPTPLPLTPPQTAEAVAEEPETPPEEPMLEAPVTEEAIPAEPVAEQSTDPEDPAVIPDPPGSFEEDIEKLNALEQEETADSSPETEPAEDSPSVTARETLKNPWTIEDNNLKEQ